ncbi:MAG: hypothetical protein Q7S20_03525 [Gemmatimonadaceae bacterium]|nr:hypothetical protein [Gemmatimonadaceae bacterium]
MRISKRVVAVLSGLVVGAAPLSAQGLYFGLRGGAGIPTGAFSDNTAASSAALDAAKSGFGYGLDAGLQLGMIGVYGGFDHINFDCQSTTCNTDGKYKLQGFAAGVKLIPPGFSMVRPWIKGGVTFNELQGGYGSSQSTELTTDRNPGYEVGAGVDIPLLGFFRLTPQARYVGQNLSTRCLA